MKKRLLFHSPIGRLAIDDNGGSNEELAVSRLYFAGQPFIGEAEEIDPDSAHDVFRLALEELDGYFNSKLKIFTVPLCPEGTEFRRTVWHELSKIPYGETRTYSDIAKAIGKEKAVRAVGQANHHNPIPIMLPCHRVIGKNGALTGFGGGLEVKDFLLKLEKGNKA